MFENSQVLNGKLREVLDLLDENQREFESVEKVIRDQDLKRVILQLMRKNQEYARQLLMRFLPDGQPSRMLKRKVQCSEQLPEAAHVMTREELLEKCRMEESAFEKAYRAVLNTGYLQDGLRQMLQLQLNELKMLFLKIRIYYMVKSNMLSPYTLRKTYF